MAENGKRSGESSARPATHELAEAQSSPLGAPESLVTPPDRGPENDQATALTLALLRRSKWTLVTVVVLLCAIAFPVIWFSVEPTYRAMASVHVAPVVSRIVFKTEENASGVPMLYSSYLNTQKELLHSTPVLERVLDHPAVRATDWYQNPPVTWKTKIGGTPPTCLERLRDGLQVKIQDFGEIINVSMIDRSGKDATEIVNILVDEYKQFMDAQLRETDVRRFETLTRERAALRKEIDGLLATKFNMAKRLGTIALEDLRSQLALQLSELEAKREELHHAHEMTKWELERHSVAALDGAGYGESADGGAMSADQYNAADEEWTNLSRAAADVRHELETARDRYGESHPRIRTLEAKLEHAERMLRRRESQLAAMRSAGMRAIDNDSEDGTPVRDRATLAVLADRQRHELELLDDQIRRQQARVAEAGDIARDVAQQEEEIAHKRELYEAVRSRLQVLELEAKAPARISVSAYAVAPTRADRDRRPTLSIMALGGSFMIGLAVVFLRNRMNPKIYEADDVRYAVHVPFLGQVPYDSSHRRGWNDADATAMECVRMIRTALLERVRGTGNRVVLITSSNSRAGKTSVAIALARSLADLGKKTLLVEADLRRPTLRERLGLKDNGGLAALLANSARDSEVMLRPGDRKPDIVLAGELPQGFDPELLADGVFAACLTRWRKKYDFILLDSPPVLPVADARILARQADGTIMVLRASHCRRTEVLQAQADLGAVGCRLLGTVLVGGAAGSQYGYGAEYAATSHEIMALDAKPQPVGED